MREFDDYGDLFVFGEIAFNGSARQARWRLDCILPCDRVAAIADGGWARLVRLGSRFEVDWVYRGGVGWVEQHRIDGHVVREDPIRGSEL